MNALSEAASLVQAGLGGLAPHEFDIGCVGHGTRDGRIKATSNAEEPFGGSVTRQELVITGVCIASQELRTVSIGTCHDESGHAENIGGEPRGHQLLDEFVGGHQDLSAQVAAFLR